MKDDKDYSPEMLELFEKRNDANDKREYHFFTSSASNWQTHACLKECQTMQEKRDMGSQYMQPKGYSIYKVFLPADVNYKINYHMPVVDRELIEFVDTVRYVQVKATAAKARRGYSTMLKIATGDDALDRG